MADIPDLGHFAYPCSESQFRGQMQSILNWIGDLQSTSIPIGGILLWAKPLADAPAGFVMADGTANSVVNGGTGKDLRGFIKISAGTPGTTVAAVNTGGRVSTGSVTGETAGTPSGSASSSQEVLTAVGTTSSTSAGTASGTTAVDPVTRHTHDHNHSYGSFTSYYIPTAWEIETGDHAGTAVVSTGTPTELHAKHPAGSLTMSNDTTPGSSHAHAFSGVTFGAHTHTFSDTSVGKVDSNEHNHTITFNGSEMDDHTHPLSMNSHDHVAGAPAAQTVIALERIS